MKAKALPVASDDGIIESAETGYPTDHNESSEGKGVPRPGKPTPGQLDFGELYSVLDYQPS